MKCVHCSSSRTKKYGKSPAGVQRHWCHACQRVFQGTYKVTLSEADKELAVKARNEGVSFRGIARLIGHCSWFAVYSFLKKSPDLPERFPSNLLA